MDQASNALKGSAGEREAMMVVVIMMVAMMMMMMVVVMMMMMVMMVMVIIVKERLEVGPYTEEGGDEGGDECGDGGGPWLSRTVTNPPLSLKSPVVGDVNRGVIRVVTT